jgi:2-polyprenyl-3-methyl-5-hydroxy-6-metoxy-1,4-benzoquinol methylase
MTDQPPARAKRSTYVFDQAWPRELDRLRSLEALFDPASQRHLAARGLGPGWHCLEVGCGAGSLALWLAGRVGSSGSVLATDLDPRFLDGHGRSNLMVIRHDLTTDALTPATFDLIHARAVLAHLRDPQAILARLVGALRPGGWLLIEDVDFGGTAATMLGRYTVPSDDAAACERAYHAIATMFARAGADATRGAQLPALLTRAGLEDIGGEVHTPIVCGVPGAWVRLSYEYLRQPMLATGLLTEADIERDWAFLSDPHSRYLPPFMVSAWGRRGATTP